MADIDVTSSKDNLPMGTYIMRNRQKTGKIIL